MIEDPGLDVPARLANSGVDGGLICVTVTFWMHTGETLTHTTEYYLLVVIGLVPAGIGTREPFPGPMETSTLIDRSAGKTAN